MIYSRLPLVTVLHTDSLRAQLVKNPPAVQETPVQSLGLGGLLGKGQAPHSSILGGSSGEGTGCPLQHSWASLVAQLIKNLPAMRETWI